MQKIHIELKEGQQIFFTSDLHFFHKNVIKFCNRPFENIKEMNVALIKNWNNVVKEDDIIFSLGDFNWYPTRHETKKLVDKLNGIKYFIPGNHDKDDMYSLCESENVFICQDIATLYLKTPNKLYEICLCHYPLMSYAHSDTGAYQFFGHIHSKKGTIMAEFGKILPVNKRQIDVGVDRWDYTPVNFNDLIKILV